MVPPRPMGDSQGDWRIEALEARMGKVEDEEKGNSERLVRIETMLGSMNTAMSRYVWPIAVPLILALMGFAAAKLP